MKILTSIAILININHLAFAEQIQSIEALFSDDFGPRLLVGEKPDYHRAIDFKLTAGTAAKTLEKCTITDVDRYSAINMVHVDLTSDDDKRMYRYLHFFNNKNIEDDDYPGYTDSGTDPKFTFKNTEQENRAIIVWQNKEQNIAKYVICKVPKNTIKYNNQYVKNSANKNIETINQLTTAANPWVGPAGDSGGYSGTTQTNDYKPHLHIDSGLLNNTPRNVSLLYYMPHKEIEYDIQLLGGEIAKGKFHEWQRDEAMVFTESENGHFIRVLVDSYGDPENEGQSDLEEVKIYLDQEDADHLIQKYSFGGVPASQAVAPHATATPVNTNIESDYNSITGIGTFYSKSWDKTGYYQVFYPMDERNSNKTIRRPCGLDMFLYADWDKDNSVEIDRGTAVNKINEIDAGKIVVVAKNVRGSKIFRKEYDIKVDKSKAVTVERLIAKQVKNNIFRNALDGTWAKVNNTPQFNKTADSQACVNNDDIKLAVQFNRKIDADPMKPKIKITNNNGKEITKNLDSLLPLKYKDANNEQIYNTYKTQVFEITPTPTPDPTPEVLGPQSPIRELQREKKEIPYFSWGKTINIGSLGFVDGEQIEIILTAQRDDNNKNAANGERLPNELGPNEEETYGRYKLTVDLKKPIISPLKVIRSSNNTDANGISNNTEVETTDTQYLLGKRKYKFKFEIEEKHINPEMPPMVEVKTTDNSTSVTAFAVQETNDNTEDDKTKWSAELVFSGLTGTVDFLAPKITFMDAAGNEETTSYDKTVQFSDEKSQTTANPEDSIECSPATQFMSLNVTDSLSHLFRLHVRLVQNSQPLKTWYFKYIKTGPGSPDLINLREADQPVEDVEVNPDQRLIFKWNAEDEQGDHAYGNVNIEIYAENAYGNGTSDNTHSFSVNPHETTHENNPTAETSQNIQANSDTGNLNFMLPSLFSLGGIEFGGLRNLFGSISGLGGIFEGLGGLAGGIDFRMGNIYGEQKWGSIDLQLDSVKKQIDNYVRTQNEKVTIMAWGEAGHLAKKYLQENTPIDKIAKLVTIGTPVRGVNSLPMATQSYALNLLFSPVVPWLEKLGLNEMLTKLENQWGDYGPDLSFLSFLRQSNRNDLVINPLNIIGLALGRFDYAQNFQSESDFMKDLNRFSTDDIGIPTASVVTRLWPDMGGLQVGIVAAFAALGAGGQYVGVRLFDLQSKTYNNINEEVAEILTSKLEEELERSVFKPIKNKITEVLENAERELMFDVWVKDAVKQEVRNRMEDLLARTGPDFLDYDQVVSLAVDEFVGKYITSPTASTADWFRKPIKDLRDQMQQGSINDLNDFLQHPLQNDVGKIIQDAFGEQTKDKVSGLIANEIGSWIPTAQIENDFDALIAVIDNIQNNITTVVNNQKDAIIVEMPATRDADQLYTALDKQIEQLFIPLEDLRKMPIRWVNSEVDRLLREKIQIPLRRKVKSFILTNLPDLNQLISWIPPLTVSIPGGLPGAIIVGALAYLATDYVINTDGVTEGSPLALSRLMGLNKDTPQTVEKQVEVKGWHFSGPNASEDIAKLISTERPKIFGLEINGTPLKDCTVAPRSHPGIGLYMLTQDSQVRDIGRISINKPYVGMRGMIQDNNVAFCKLKVAFNYEPFWDVPVTQDGIFQLYTSAARQINLLEGINTVVMIAENKYGGVARQVFQINLDMMPIQIAPDYPSYEAFIKEKRPVMSAIIYNTDANNSIPEGNITVTMQKITEDTAEEIDTEILSATPEKLTFRLGSQEADLNNGYYTILVKAKDESENESQSAWGFYYDDEAPTVDIKMTDNLEFTHTDPDAPASLKVRYEIDDNLSPLLSNTRITIRQMPGNIVVYSDFMQTRSKGSTLLNWDYKTNTDSFPVPMFVSEGNYELIVETEDLAGNAGSQIKPFKIDLTPPVIDSGLALLKMDLNQTPITDKQITNDFNGFYIKYQVDGDCSVKFIMYNETKRLSYTSAQRAYADNQRVVDVDENNDPVYETNPDNFFAWDLTNPFMNIPDGEYTLMLIPKDDAGNVGAMVSVQNIIVDRKPPLVTDFYVQPYVLGGDSGQVSLYYTISQEDDIPEFQGEPVNVEVKVVRKDDLSAVKTYDPAAVLTDPLIKIETHSVLFDGISEQTSLPIPMGRYAYVITATDSHGSHVTKYADFIKDGVAPHISYPDDPAEKLYNTVVVRGIAKDPVRTNAAKFKEYRLYYQTGHVQAPGTLGELAAWQTAHIEVPVINRKSEVERYVSLRAVDNNGVLGYWHTQTLADGEYTLLLAVLEEDTVDAAGQPVVGTFMLDIAFVLVDKGVLDPQDPDYDPNAKNPIITLQFANPPPVHDFTVLPELPVEFDLTLQDVNQADISLTIFDQNNYQVSHQTQLNVNDREVDSEPPFETVIPINQDGASCGIYVWQDQDAWHLRVNGDGDSNTWNAYRFAGILKTNGLFKVTNLVFDKDNEEGITYQTGDYISFECLADSLGHAQNNLDGFDFTTTGEWVSFDLYNNGDPLTEEHTGWINIAGQIETSGNVVTKYFVKRKQQFIWDGKDPYDAMVPNGPYTFVLTALGHDNQGYAQAVQSIQLTSPLILIHADVEPDEFSPLAGLEGGNEELTSSSLRFALSKDALVSVDITNPDQGDAHVCTLSQATLCQGGEEWIHTVVWKGNSPTASSRLLAGSGPYQFRFHAEATDDASQTIDQTFDVVINNVESSEDVFATLEIIGHADQPIDGIPSIRGESSYYLEIFGEGNWYPPIPFEYTLHAFGTQTIIQYPFVPFVTKARKYYDAVTAMPDVPTPNDGALTYRERDYKVSLEFTGYYLLDGEKSHGLYPGELNNRTYTFTRNNPALKFDHSYVSPPKYNNWLSTSYYKEDIQRAHYAIAIKPLAIDTLFDVLHFDVAQNQREVIQSASEMDNFGFSAPYNVTPMIRAKDGWDNAELRFWNGEIKYQGWDPEFSYNNLTNRFTQWASENSYYYGAEDDGEEIVPIQDGESPADKQPATHIYRDASNKQYQIQYTLDGTPYTETITAPSKHKYVNYWNYTDNDFAAEDLPNTYLMFAPGYENYLSAGPNYRYDLFPVSEGEIWKSAEELAGLTSYTPEKSTLNDKNRVIFERIGPQRFRAQSRLWLPVFEAPFPFSPTEQKDQAIVDFILDELNADPDKHWNKDFFPKVGDVGYYSDNHNYMELNPDKSFINYGDEQNNAAQVRKTNQQLTYDPDVDGYAYEIDPLEDFNQGLLYTYGPAIVEDGNGSDTSITFETGLAGVQGKEKRIQNITLEGFTTSDLVNLSSLPGKQADIHLGASATEKVYFTGKEFDTYWSTADDPALSNTQGLIRSVPDSMTFDSAPKMYLLKDLYPFASQNPSETDEFIYGQHAYWATGYNSVSTTPQDNPEVSVRDWDIRVRYMDGSVCEDFELYNQAFHDNTFHTQEGQEFADAFEFKLVERPGGKWLVEIRGAVSGGGLDHYELYYYDNDGWHEVLNSADEDYAALVADYAEGVLGYWDVTGLVGRYTVLLRAVDSQNHAATATREVVIGTYIEAGSSLPEHSIAHDPYKRATLGFKPGSFDEDTVVTVNSVPLSKAMVTSKPAILPLGPVIQIAADKEVSFTDPQDQPTLTFRFTYQEAMGYGLIGSTNIMTIHYMNADGELESLETDVSYYKLVNGSYEPPAPNDSYQDEFENGDSGYVIVAYASVEHFSYYLVLKGGPLPAGLTLEQPVSPTITTSITINGTGAVNYTVECYVDDDADYANTDYADSTPPILQTQTFEIITPISGLNTIGAYSMAIDLLFEGENYIFVKYAGLENSPMVRRMVVRDLRPAQFTLFEVENPKFSPNNDGVKDTTSVRFALDETADVIFKLYDTSGNEIDPQNTKIQSEPQMTQISQIKAEKDREYQIIWEGLKPDGTQYPEGVYTVRLFVADAMGNISPESSQVKSIKLDLTPPEITNTINDLGDFSPNQDGINDSIDIPFALSEYAYVSATVRDSDNHIVWRLGNPLILLNPYNHVLTWDGSVIDDSLLAEKTYTIHLKAMDEAGNSSITKYSTVTVDLTQLTISRLSVAPVVFSSQGGYTVLSYHVNDNAEVSIKVNAANSALVRTIQTNKAETSGYHQITWDGLNANYHSVEPGEYTFEVSAQDTAGHVAETQSVSVEVAIDTALPLATIVDVTPNTITPNCPTSLGQNDVARIRFSLWDEVSSGGGQSGSLRDVRLRIYKYGQLVRNLAQYAGLEQGDGHEALWDGKDELGQFVPDGSYVVLVTCQDNSGNRSSSFRPESRGVIYVDNQAPEIFGVSSSLRVLSGQNGNDETVISYFLRDNMQDEPGFKFHTVITAYNYSDPGTVVQNITTTAEDLPKWNHVTWNVKNLAEGTYFYRIFTQDPGGNPAIENGYGTIVVDKSPPQVNVVSVGVDTPFSPSPPDGLKDTNEIQYFAADYADNKPQITINILDSQDLSQVKKLIENSPIASGNTKAAVWNGTKDNGMPADDGLYIYEVMAVDVAGNSAHAYSVPITLDTTPPAGMTDVSVDPEIFSPNGDGIKEDTTIRYTAPDEDVIVTHKIVGEADRFNWEAEGQGLYYPPKTFDYEVVVEGRRTNYVYITFTCRVEILGIDDQQNIIYPIERGIRYDAIEFDWTLTKDFTCYGLPDDPNDPYSNVTPSLGDGVEARYWDHYSSEEPYEPYHPYPPNLTRIENTPWYDWGLSGPTDFIHRVLYGTFPDYYWVDEPVIDQFQAQWRGALYIPPHTQELQFRTTSDDGQELARIHIDQNRPEWDPFRPKDVLIDDWMERSGPDPDDDNSVSRVTQSMGAYLDSTIMGLQYSMFDDYGYAKAQLEWNLGPGGAWEPIPQRYWYSRPPDDTHVTDDSTSGTASWSALDNYTDKDVGVFEPVSTEEYNLDYQVINVHPEPIIIGPQYNVEDSSNTVDTFVQGNTITAITYVHTNDDYVRDPNTQELINWRDVFRPGLYTEYYHDLTFTDLAATTITPSVFFDWQTGPGINYPSGPLYVPFPDDKSQGLPLPQVRPSNFSIRWTGLIYAPEDGQYRFTVILHDNGARLWIGDQLVIDSWYHDDGYKNGYIELEGGRWHPIRFEMMNRSSYEVYDPYASDGNERELLWMAPSGSGGHSVTIPNEYFILKSWQEDANLLAHHKKENYSKHLNELLVSPRTVILNDTFRQTYITVATNTNTVRAIFSESKEWDATELTTIYYTDPHAQDFYVLAKPKEDAGKDIKSWTQTSDRYTVTADYLHSSSVAFADPEFIESIPNSDNANAFDEVQSISIKFYDPDSGEEVTDIIAGYFNYQLNWTPATQYLPVGVTFTCTSAEPFTTLSVQEFRKENDEARFNFAGVGEPRNVYESTGLSLPTEIATRSRIYAWSITPTASDGSIREDIIIDEIIGYEQEDPDQDKYNGDFTVRLADSLTIRTLVDGNTITANTEVEQLWDGKNDTGLITPDGEYKSMLWGYDQAWNWRLDKHNVIVDTMPPGAAITRINEQGITGIEDPIDATGVLEIYGTADDLHFERYILNYTNVNIITRIGEGTAPVQDGLLGILDTAGLNGSTILTLYAEDAAGNSRTVIVNLNLINDTDYVLRMSPKTDWLISPNGDGFKDYYEVDYFTPLGITLDYVAIISRINENEIQLLAEGITQPAGSHSLVWNGSQSLGGTAPDGMYYFSLTATAQIGGNELKAYRVGPIEVDLNTPTAEVVLEGTILEGTISVSGTAKDKNFDYYEVRYENFTNLNENFADWILIKTENIEKDHERLCWFNTQGLEGDYRVGLFVMDQAGNSSYAFADLTIDNERPNVAIMHPHDGDILGGTIPVEALINDDHIASWTLEYGQGASPLSWVPLTDGSSNVSSAVIYMWDTVNNPPSGGDITLRIVALDQAGNQTVVNHTFTLDNTRPVAVIDAPGNSAAVNGIVEIRGTADDLHFKEYKINIHHEGTKDTKEIGVNKVINDKLGEWDTVNEEDGTYDLELIVEDLAGNSSYAYVGNLTIDREGPEVKIESPRADEQALGENPLLTGTVDVAASISGNDLNKYILDYRSTDYTDEWTELQSQTITEEIENQVIYQWNTETIQYEEHEGHEGIYRLRLKAFDQANNPGTDEVTVEIDNQAPLVTIHAPDDQAHVRGAVDVFASIAETHPGVSALMMLPPVGWPQLLSQTTKVLDQDQVYRLNTADYNDGQYVLELSQTDALGNHGAQSITLQFDNTVPVLDITSPGPNTPVGESAVIIGTVTDPNLERYILNIYHEGTKDTKKVIEGNNQIINSQIGIWDSSTAEEGMYTAALFAVDQAGNSNTVSANFMVDHTLPVITDLGAEPNPFSPMSVANKITRIKYELNEKCLVSAWVLDGTGNTITGIIENETKGIGENYIEWNGVSDSGWPNYAPAGTYTYFLAARDLAGNLGAPAVGQVTVSDDVTAPVIASLSVDPAWISPNSDGIQEAASIAYELTDDAESAVRVEMGIWGIENPITGIKQIIGGLHNTGVAYSVQWDGRDDEGNLVDDGEYLVKLTAWDAANNPALAEHTIYVDTAGSQAVGQAVPGLISPNSDNTLDSTQITLNLTDNFPVYVTFTAQVRDAADQLIRTLGSTNALLPDVAQYTWNGLRDDTSQAGDGVYHLALDLQDQAGNAVDLDPVEIRVDLTVPDTEINYSRAPYTDPAGNHYSNIHTHPWLDRIDPLVNNVSAGVARTLYKVRSVNDPVIPPANMWEYYGGPFYLINVWLDAEGNTQFAYWPDGEYAADFVSVDHAGNTMPVRTRVFRVDNTPPITDLNTDPQITQIDTDIYSGLGGTIFTLNASDAYCGLSATALSIDAGDWTYDPAPFTLALGEHTLAYYSLDNVGNSSTVESISVLIVEPTATPSSTPSSTSTVTATWTVTASPTASKTATPTATPSATNTATPSASPTSTDTETSTASPTATDTTTPTASPTDTATGTPSFTATSTASPSSTATPSSTVTPTASPTTTSTATPSDTASPTASPSATATDTTTATITVTATDTATPTASPSATPSSTSTVTASPTPWVNQGCAILSPCDQSLVNGYVHIVGITGIKKKMKGITWVLTYRAVAGGETVTISQGRKPVIIGLLGVWNTRHLDPGWYDLILTVERRSLRATKGSAAIYDTDEIASSASPPRNDILQHTVRVRVGDWTFLGQIGTGVKGAGNDQFNEPWDAEADQYGNLYVTDAKNDRVQKFNADDQYVMTIGSRGTRPGEFKLPTNLAIGEKPEILISKSETNSNIQNSNDKNEIYIVDYQNRRVQVLDLEGIYIRSYEPGIKGIKGKLHELKWPVAVCTDIKNIAYILDGNGKIYTLSGDGELGGLKANLGNGVEAACHNPLQHYTDLAADYSIQKLSTDYTDYTDSENTAKQGKKLNLWKSVKSVDHDFEVLTFDRVHQVAHKVDKLDEHGKKLYSYKGTQNKYEPQNAKTGPLGNVWISDLKYNRVQEFGPYGNLIGTFGGFGSTPGKFDRPHGITFKGNLSTDYTDYTDSEKSLKYKNDFNLWESVKSVDQVFAYVVDTGNQRVQKFGMDLSSGWPTPGPAPTPAARLEVLALSAQPAAFIAEDGQKTTISYLVTKPALVRVTVMDRFGGLVRDLGQNQVETPGWMQYITWDGRSNFGTFVAPDVYTIRAEAHLGPEHHVATTPLIVLAQGQEPPTAIPTPTGVITPVWTPTPLPTWTPTPIPTPTPDLELSDCFAAPNPFRPETGQTTWIHYTLNMDAGMHITIREKGSGKIVRQFGPFMPGSPYSHVGQNKIEWDGSEDGGDVDPAAAWKQKKYECTIRAEILGQVEVRTIEIIKEKFK